MILDKENMLALLRRMILIRAFEKKVDFLFARGLIKGTCHVCVGQEAIPVALCAALGPGDYAVGTHRGHGLALAKGVPERQLVAEILGKAGGVCGGRGGSQHSAWAPACFLGTNGITSGGLPLAAGAAFASQYAGNGHIVAVTLGDGGTNEGVFHETLNLASLWNLPILFVCENNLYGMSTPVHKASAEPLLWKRATAYRIESERVDGNDLAGLLTVFENAVRAVRSEQRPRFIECMTYRWMGHSKSDPRVYRSREEEAEWRARCPIQRWREQLLAQGVATDDELKALEHSLHQEFEQMTQAVADEPAASPNTLYDHVYAN